MNVTRNDVPAIPTWSVAPDKHRHRRVRDDGAVNPFIGVAEHHRAQARTVDVPLWPGAVRLPLTQANATDRGPVFQVGKEAVHNWPSSSPRHQPDMLPWPGGFVNWNDGVGGVA